MALLVWLVPAAAGAEAAAQQAAAEIQGRDPAVLQPGDRGIRGGWILTGTLSPIPKTDVIVRTDEHFNVVARNDAAIPDTWRAQGYVHIGDIDVVGNVVYAPFEQPDYSKGHQVTARYDARTLRFIDAVELDQNENSFVTVDPNDSDRVLDGQLRR